MLDTTNLPRAYGHGITARNVNDALPLALMLINQNAVPVVSRGLNTLEVPGPVMTVYQNPCENVLLDPVRDANPFFHFFESMWILAGSERVDFPTFFLPSLAKYSDNGTTFHGAYGHRLRNYPGKHGAIDQLEAVVQMLREKPDTRQAVASIWNAARDLGTVTADMPCNDLLMFKVRDGKLNLTVCNRSNDAIWGAYGANAVQFSFILQYVAARAGLEVGKYVQFSDSLHVYTDIPLWQQYAAGSWRPDGLVVNPYDHDWNLGEVGDLELWSVPGQNVFRDSEDAWAFYQDAQALDLMLCQGLVHRAAMWPATSWSSLVGRYVARPMLLAFLAYRAGDLAGAIATASHIQRKDWSLACVQWLERRAAKRSAA